MAENKPTGQELADGSFDSALFKGQNLSHAHMARGRFSKANFKEANLTEADLTYTDLTDARFQGANLEGANFKGAMLLEAQGIDFNDALMARVKMDPSEFSVAKYKDCYAALLKANDAWEGKEDWNTRTLKQYQLWVYGVGGLLKCLDDLEGGKRAIADTDFAARLGEDKDYFINKYIMDINRYIAAARKYLHLPAEHPAMKHLQDFQRTL